MRTGTKVKTNTQTNTKTITTPTLAHLADPYLPGSRTVLGALLGGLLAVEGTKRVLGITRRTGDLFAIPLAVGITIGRVGCLLMGPADRTWGAATTMPWGIDAGAGARLHPSPLYEVLFLAPFAVIGLALGIWWWPSDPRVLRVVATNVEPLFGEGPRRLDPPQSPSNL